MTHPQPAKKVELKALDASHLRKIARIHREAFPASAWTKLGTKVVENYYLWQLNGPHRIVMATGAFVDGECVGFLFGGIFNGSTSGFIKKNKFLLLQKSLLRPWLVFDSLFLERLTQGVKILRRFSAKKSKVTPQPSVSKPQSFGLLALAVSPRFQKSGIGRMLMASSEGFAVNYGYDRMHLTVNPTNHQAIRLYENLGWHKSEDFSHGVMRKSVIVTLEVSRNS